MLILISLYLSATPIEILISRLWCSLQKVVVEVRQYQKTRLLKRRLFDSYQVAEEKAIELSKKVSDLNVHIYVDGEIYGFIVKGQIVTLEHGPRPI